MYTSQIKNLFEHTSTGSKSPNNLQSFNSNKKSKNSGLFKN